MTYENYARPFSSKEKTQLRAANLIGYAQEVIDGNLVFGDHIAQDLTNAVNADVGSDLAPETVAMMSSLAARLPEAEVRNCADRMARCRASGDVAGEQDWKSEALKRVAQYSSGGLIDEETSKALQRLLG